MIKATLTVPGGKTLIILGFSGDNLSRLLDDQPVLIRGAEIQIADFDIMVMGAPTEDGILDQIRKAGLLK